MSSGLAEAGFDLEDITVTRAGARSVVRVVVDRDGGIDLDAVADASRLASDLLDAAGSDDGGLPAGSYVLEVTSPGVDRPLTQPRHWRRAVGRLVTVRDQAGEVLSGRILSADEVGADLSVVAGPVRRGRPPRRRLARVSFTEVARATVEVEFSAGADDEDASAGEDAAVDTPGMATVPDAAGGLPGATDRVAPLGDGDDDGDGSAVSPAVPVGDSNDEGRQADAQGAAGEEMTR